MNIIIDAGSAKLAGLQIDTLTKYRTGKLSLEHWERFVNLTPEEREIRFGDLKKLESKLPAAITELEPPIDPVIRVDRLISPTYPSWVKKVCHHELENTGPRKFDVTRLDLWLHNDQKTDCVTGTIIYDSLRHSKLLKSCLGLRDLEEIKKKGINFFRKYFKGKAIFAWKGVVQGGFGLLRVPSLYEGGGGVVLRWNCVGNDWNSRNPAARFAS